MKQNPYFILTELSGVLYLLPFGQAIVEHSRGIQINATGADIWNHLQTPHSEAALIQELSRIYEISPSEMDDFSSDISGFLNRLLELGILVEDQNPGDICAEAPVLSASLVPPDSLPLSKTLSIAGITLELYGKPEAFSAEFDAFLQTDSPEPELPSGDSMNSPKRKRPLAIQRIFVTHAEPPIVSSGIERISHPELFVYEYQDAFLLTFPSSQRIQNCWLSKDGTTGILYCTNEYDPLLQYDLFHAIRSCFLYLAAKHGRYALHSASLLYRDRAWLFSGPSGTGKSTHTGLWKTYKKTPILNGDLNLLALDHNNPVIYGIPWCGTSGICDTGTHPLGGITLLKKDASNRIYPLSRAEEMLLVLQRLISPLWTRSMMEEMLDFVRNFTPGIRVFQLGCTISQEAVDTIQKEIDYSCSDQTFAGCKANMQHLP